MARCTTCSTGVTSLGCAANSRRSGIGSDSTHWRTGARGSEPGHEQSGGLFVPGERPGGNARAWSTRWAAVWAMRLAPQDGQKPRRLQLKATSLSWPQSPQRSRRKPWARMPHSRKASNSSFTNCGSSAPAALQGREIKLGLRKTWPTDGWWAASSSTKATAASSSLQPAGAGCSRRATARRSRPRALRRAVPGPAHYGAPF